MAVEKPVTFNARLKPEHKDLLQRAAGLRGLTLTDFVMQAALEQATDVVSRSDVLTLSMRDYERFVHAIDEPADVDNVVVARFLDAHATAQ